MRDEPIPNFRSHQSGGMVMDGGLLMVIAFCEYMKHTDDMPFLRMHYPSLIRAMQWYTRRFDQNLISEWFLCEWADAVLKVGKTLYTNVLYVKALQDMSQLAGIMKQMKDRHYFLHYSRNIQKSFVHTFWNGTYLSDWYDYKRQDYFASHANFLAILYNLVDQKQALSIVDYTNMYCSLDFTMETNYPLYPLWRIGPLQLMVGMGDYHNRGCLWLQPGITYAISLWNVGRKQEAKIYLAKIARQIIKHKGVYEVYEKDGSPVRRIFYVSEHPFAWSSGLYLWAYYILTS